MNSKPGLIATAAAVLLVIGVTLLQGTWTERWIERRSDLLEDAARRLERSFPGSFGQWALDRQLETSKAELDRAGAVGSISRIYRHEKTKTPVSAFIVCATPHDASGHTPDRCYPGAGFEIAEPEHRQTIELPDGRVAETFTGTFAKQGQTIRVFWTYGVMPNSKHQRPPTAGDEGSPEAPAGSPWTLQWLAPQIARIALNDYPAVYKLYAIVDQTKLSPSRATAECSDFIAELLPALEAALVADQGGAAPAEPAMTKDRAAAGDSSG